MADPGSFDIITDRNVDDEVTWSVLNEDWTGSTFKMQVRAVRDTTGTPLLEATSTSPGSGAFSMAVVTGTVAAHVTAGDLLDYGDDNVYAMINPATGDLYQPTDSVTLTRVRLGILAFYLESFPYPDEVGAGQRGDDFVAYHDIIRTPVSGSPELFMRGTFTVRSGVTIP